MKTRLRGPLGLAVIVALLPLVWATHATWTAPFRHTASPTATASALAQATAWPTPRPTPTPTPLPSLIVPDHLDLGAPRAFGRIDITGYDYRGQIDIGSYTLVSTPKSMPSSLPVWKLRGLATAVDTSPLAARLGIHAPSTPLPTGATPDGRISVAEGLVWAGSGNVTTILNAGTQPADDKSAIAAVARVLSDLGIMPQNADATAIGRDDGSTPTWDVRFTRRPIQGVTVGFGLWYQGAADVQITQLGNITRLSVDGAAVDGGASYSLRTWREAWADVSRGHWFDECCYVNTGGGGPSEPLAFHADRVALVYEAVGFPASYLVPMYEFIDTHKNDAALTVPALRLADLSQPGGFRLIQPGAG